MFGGQAILALALASIIPLISSGCGDEVVEVAVAEIYVNPASLQFTVSRIGEPSAFPLTIGNRGTGTLIVDRIEIDSRSTEFQMQEVSLPFSLEQNQERVIEVYYTPADCVSDRGNIHVFSNDPDPDDKEKVIPLQPSELTGQVRVNPNPVDFGRVPAGDAATLTTRIENTGTCSLTINDLFLTGSFDFSFTQSDGADGLIEYTPTLPITLDTAEYYEIDITFAPTNDGFDEATLIVRSDDAGNRTVDVPVVANGDQACIVVTDEDGIDFGARFIGDTHEKAVTITNCSQRQDLEVYSIELGPHFELQGSELFGLSGLPDLTEPLIIIPGGTSSFTLTYTPIVYTFETHPELCDEGDEVCEVPDGATLSLTSNDSVKSPLDIPVRGVGTNNHCPVAEARARVRGDTAWDVIVDTIPLAVVEFDGSGSYDSEGEIQSYQWEVTEAPADSVAIFEPGADVANPEFFLDLAGEYLFTLRVFDQHNVESCDPATIEAIAVPNEAIHIQLVWETAGDRNRTDTGAGRGSDVDLHFLHPNGTWDNRDGQHGDCHWKDREPNWGDTTSSTDNPSLDRDDTDGWGPENINLDEPQGTSGAPVIYSVGVFYFSDHDYGASDTTVRIFINGEERFASTYFGLEDREFWDVSRIEWPSGEITRIHRLYPSGFP